MKPPVPGKDWRTNQGAAVLIAQITDIHLGFEAGNPGELNRVRLDGLLAHLRSGPSRPDVLLVTGDLTDNGDAQSYAALAEALADCDFPVLMGVGNHDDRENLRLQFPYVPETFGFVQYVTEIGGLRILMLDTLENGRHGGAFCELRAGWLRARLAEAPDTPTLIAMHHPPVEAGIDWMNTVSDEPWVARFEAAIRGADQIVGIVCGHVHRPAVTTWRGKHVAICASSAPQVALNFELIDPEAPDERAMIVAEPPSCAFHRWNGGELITHFDIAHDTLTLARYDHRLQPLVRHLIEERPGGPCGEAIEPIPIRRSKAA